MSACWAAIVNILSPDRRYEVSNYKNVMIPTNFDVKRTVKDRFGEFYAALFDKTVEANPGAVITEFGAGFPTGSPRGIVTGPDGNLWVAMAGGNGAIARVTKAGEVTEVDDGVIDDGLSIVRKMWDAGLAHRDVKLANLLVRDGRLLLPDQLLERARPHPHRQRRRCVRCRRQ